LGQPRVAGGVVIVVPAEGGLAAFRESDGAPLWHGLPGTLGAASQTTLYGNIGFEEVVAWSPQTGRGLWEYQSARKVNGLSEPSTLLAANAHTVLIGTPRGSAALDAASGTLLWESSATFDAPYFTGAGADPAFYGAHAGRIVAVRASDGAVLWQASVAGYEAGGVISMLLVDGALFAMLEGPACFSGGCLSNRLVALDAFTGDVDWWRAVSDAFVLAQVP
jgi:outer membrane protein assembly factor BamB